ncbi:hypothetical protein D3C76_512380 [compost metagenome]
MAILSTISTISTNAKPLTAPVPKANITAATITVVTLESITVRKEDLLPALTEESTLFPLRISSLIRSFVMILASTAIPIPRINAAIPGNVNVKSAKTKTTISSHVCKISAKLAKRPGKRYIPIMKIRIIKEPIRPAWIV